MPRGYPGRVFVNVWYSRGIIIPKSIFNVVKSFINCCLIKINSQNFIYGYCILYL